MDEIEKNAKRLNDLETSMMYLQNENESLNQVVLENSRRLEQMANKIQLLTNRLQSVIEPPSERSAEDEIPPHY